jgi:hypothetical protein
MSRQSKNARNLAKARDISKMHANGEKGPARTSPAHGKKWGYRDNPEVLKRIAEMRQVDSARCRQGFCASAGDRMKVRLGTWLIGLAHWVLGSAEAVREIAAAVAYARQHPTDLQDR